MHAPAALHLDETHALDGLTALATGALALIGVMGVAVSADDLAMTAGGAGVLTGLTAQMVSRTRPERFVDVVGLTLCALCLVYGLVTS